MNSSSIRIWYETGSVDEIHLPDPSFESGYAVQREYVDVSNPDSGIFVERSYIPAVEGEGPEYYSLLATERTLVVSPENLAGALVVECHGTDVLRRDPLSPSRCGLSPCAAEALGFKAGTAAGIGFLRERVSAAAAELMAMGDEGEEALRAALESLEGPEEAAG